MSSTDRDAATEPTFSAAMEELEAVLRRIEGEEIDIDQLAAELGRAATLLEVCRGKIRRAEVEVRQIVEQIEQESGSAEDGSRPAPRNAGSGAAAKADPEPSKGAPTSGELWSSPDEDDDIPF